jgi:hypothetical protein
MKQNKKGIQLNEAVTAIVTLVLIAVLVIVGIYLFSSLGYSVMTPGTSATVTNETLNAASTAGITLTTGNAARDGSCGAITRIYNGTTGVVLIGTGNVTQIGCTVKNATDWTGVYSSTVRYSYPYTFTNGTAASDASDTTITQFSAYPALVGLVGTIIFLGIVIGVLVASFAFGKKGA